MKTLTYQTLLENLQQGSMAATIVSGFPTDQQVNLRELGKALDDAGLSNRQIAKVHQIIQENQPVVSDPDPFADLTHPVC